MIRKAVYFATALLISCVAHAQGRAGISPPDPYTMTNQTVAGDSSYVENYNYGGRTQIFPSLVGGEHTTILIIWGDSLAAATDNSAYSPTNPTKVQNFSLQNGGVYLAASPDLTCTNNIAANGGINGFWGDRLADTLITNGKTQRVIVICSGIGGTGTTLWSTAQFNYRFGVLFRRLNSLGLLSANRIFLMSSIGGLDQTQALGAATMQTNLNTIITAIRAAGFSTTPIYLALSSWGGGGTGGANGTAIRTGITNAIAGNANTFTGADTDTIVIGNRYDNNHYTSTGSASAATLWYNVIQGIFP